MDQTYLFPEARMAADAAVDKVAKGVSKEWLDQAVAYGTKFVKTCDTPFIAKDIRDYCYRVCGLPKHREPRVFGAVIRELERLGVIKRIGRCSPKHAHTAPVAVWAAA